MSIGIVNGGVANVAAMLDVMADAFDPRFGEAWSGAQLSGTMAQPGSWARLAVDDELVVGFALCRRIVDEAELLLVAVRRAMRSRGIGGHLLQTAARDAVSGGARSMFLEMRDGNAAALHLYRRMGYVEVGRRRDYYRGVEGNRFDAMTLRCDLERLVKQI